MSGRLFIISTPIGNLGDLSPRTKDAFAQADLLLVEDTRVTIKLLNHLGLSKKMLSCHKFNEQSRLDIVREAATNSQTLALVSDAGTPMISDPGHRIVSAALDAGMEVIAIPGPTALIQALVASGLPCERFTFEGFLQDTESDLRKQIEPLRNETRTMVFYISPHGLERKLSVLQDVFDSRRACLARELTKLNEEYIRAPLNELTNHLSSENLRGEFTLIIEGQQVRIEEKGTVEAVSELARCLLAEGESVKSIAAECQKTFGWRKSEAYSLIVQIKNDLEEPDISSSDPQS